MMIEIEKILDKAEENYREKPRLVILDPNKKMIKADTTSLSSCIMSILVFQQQLNTYEENVYDLVQCSGGRRRSIEDIYRTCLTYFPDASLQEVHEILYDIVENTKVIDMLICPDIKRRVYLYNKFGGWANRRFSQPVYLGNLQHDEFGFHNDDIINYYDKLQKERGTTECSTL